ncbi:GmrSD restriction endonuclease domain-containing protein [Odoribacter splanchnicus]|uniref:DUF1524 domain-containing protein n=1 Tax=Odoribacter splanchnicus TaxID=28118 RepID=A0AAW6FKP1_9BACT|nr:DUF1524 domain-containing protein [Odoribacter splanchnicus]MDB9209103.1 DUF1524 domain-containing protein [Odoribacter splanchnicus]MDB9216606.1 DUF1524 domain-containing protein [Odoribacter splanchnicus]MDB9224563.1 DUF1524 domain-containing protein [Odoribacter splanchnicus]
METVNSVLEYDNFLKRDYTNLNTRFLRYLLARVELYICEHSRQEMQNDVMYIATKTGYKTGYHIEHILSRNATNMAYFDSEEEFESQRNILGGLLLLKDRDNISSGNEEYADKLKTYSNGLVWGHSLCEDFYHCNKDIEDFCRELKNITQGNLSFQAYSKFDKETLYQRSRLLFELIRRPLKTIFQREVCKSEVHADFSYKPQKNSHSSFEVICGRS